MPEAAFVMSASQHYPVRELAATLKYELELQAVSCSLHFDGFPPARPDQVYLLLDPWRYAEIEDWQALPDDAILRRTIFLCTERALAPTEDEHIALLRRAGAVFVLDQRSVVALHRVGIPARLLRPGYSKSLDHFDREAARPIDVMFLGTHSLRRTRYLSHAARVLSRHNCLLQISEPVASTGDTSSFLGPGRWPLLAQTKILINLHRDDGDRFEWRRALDAIHAGAVVVSEHSSGITPFVAAEHLLVAAPDALPYAAEVLLADESRLARLRDQAYERLSAWVPSALWVSVLRAAIVELVGEPVSEGVSLGTAAPRAAPPARSGAAREAGAVDGMPCEPERVRVVGETPAFAARRSVRVTVMIAVSAADDDRIVATLDSVARTRMRDLELVIVCSGSEEVATRWMAKNPRLPMRLVRAPGAGLGSARNVALDFARGSLCLPLDPGHELYPRCLDVLVGTLDAMPEMAFVYPIQEVVGAPQEFTDAGGDHLMSFLGWDPGRLCRGNHIHVPALIRTESLRSLGGFATDHRLAGFEDYDLWCRMADRGWSGQLVPQELARRSESSSSPALRALHPAPGTAMAALMERAPRLMSRAFPVG